MYAVLLIQHQITTHWRNSRGEGGHSDAAQRENQPTDWDRQGVVKKRKRRGEVKKGKKERRKRKGKRKRKEKRRKEGKKRRKERKRQTKEKRKGRKREIREEGNKESFFSEIPSQ